MITLNSEALERWLANISISEEELEEALLFAGGRLGVEVEALLRFYPPVSRRKRKRMFTWPKNGNLSIWQSQKQQGWFFANLKKGTLTLPYTRTGLLGNSITSDAEYENGILRVEAGSNLEYAPLVIGDPDADDPAERQSWWHAEGGWPSAVQEIETHAPSLQAGFFKSVLDHLT